MFEDREDSFNSVRNGPDDASGPTDLGPTVQLGVMTLDVQNELEGELLAFAHSHLVGDNKCIRRDVWRLPSGRLVQVAVKMLKPVWPTSSTTDAAESRERVENNLKREIFVWTRLNHRNLHPILGFRFQPSPHLISTWCYHGNLAEYLRCNPQFSRIEKVQLLVQAAKGLAYLHSQFPPICHANIKPGNIIVNDWCEAALTDFGLGQASAELGPDGPKDGPDYIAPELFETGNPQPSPESDVYAFGSLVLAVMGGYEPFAGLQYPKRMYLIDGSQERAPRYSPLLEVHDSLWLLIYRCRSPHRWSRPPMAHVIHELDREIDFLARPPKAPRQAAADIIQLQVDTSSISSGVLISSNVRSDHCAMPVDPQRSVDVTTVEHNENIFQAHSLRSSQHRPYLFLHNLQRQGKVFYRETALADGPRHSEIWTATILIFDGPDGNIVGTYSAQASTKRGARDAASEQALAVLGYASSDETSLPHA